MMGNVLERLNEKAENAAGASVDAFGEFVEKKFGTEKVEAAIDKFDAFEEKLETKFDEKMAPVEAAVDKVFDKAFNTILPSDRETWLTRLINKFI